MYELRPQPVTAIQWDLTTEAFAAIKEILPAPVARACDVVAFSIAGQEVEIIPSQWVVHWPTPEGHRIGVYTPAVFDAWVRPIEAPPTEVAVEPEPKTNEPEPKAKKGGK